MLLEHLPSHLHQVIEGYDPEKMRKIMELMRVRIHFFKDMAKHTYFFEAPHYMGDIADKFHQKLKQPDEVKRSLLKDIAAILDSLPDSSEFHAQAINR